MNENTFLYNLRYAFGLNPNFKAFSSVIIKTADAPSV